MEGELIKLYALDKEDLIFLVKGGVPHFDVFDHELLKERGYYTEQRGWVWHDYKLHDLQTHELYMIHKLCKDSWKEVNKRGN